MVSPQVKNRPTGAEISVIIPSYCSAKTLGRCLESVLNQNIQQRYDVIVVHSGPEPVAEEIYQAFHSVIFFSFTDKWLPGKARNWAARQLQSSWVFFLDSDCVVKPDWLATMLATLTKYDVDGVGGGVRNATPYSPIAWTMHLLEFGEWLPDGQPRLCKNFPSCNALYKRSSLLNVGGFPEDLFPCEDTLLNYKLCQQGYRLYFLPQCAAEHIHLKNLRKLLRHNYIHGQAFCIACKSYRLQGHFLIHLSRGVLCVLVPVRLVRIFSRLIPRQLPEALILLLCFPLALISLFAWTLGFVHEKQKLAG